MSEPVLSVRDLTVSFPDGDGRRRDAGRRLSLDLFPGTFSALVGESGSGKSVSAMSLLGLVPSPPARIGGESVMYRFSDGREADLLREESSAMRRVRGGELAMIFLEPMTGLYPVRRVGDQVAEAVRLLGKLHGNAGRRAAARAAVGDLERVGIPDAARRSRQHPHEFSGGMRQRVMIAIALACGPRVLIADEPTTALDVTIQASILDLIRGLVDEEGLSVLLITHDLALVRAYADRVAVLYRGVLLEEGPCERVLGAPAHPYTRGRLATAPDLGDTRARLVTMDSVMASGVDSLGGRARGYSPWTPGELGGTAVDGDVLPGMVGVGAGQTVRASGSGPRRGTVS